MTSFKIAIINLVTQSVDAPLGVSKVFNSRKSHIETDQEINVIELGMRMTRLGNDVTIFVSDAFLPSRSIGEQFDGLHIRYLPTKLKMIFPYMYYPFTPDLLNALTDCNYDIVQSAEFFNSGTILSLIAASKKKFPLVIWHELGIDQRFPGNLVQDFYCNTIGKTVSRRVSIIPRSTSAKDWLMQKGLNKGAIGPVVNTGVNTDVFFPRQDIGALKAKFDVPDDNLLVVSVGRLHRDKGLNNLIMAMNYVVKKYTNISLIIKGSGPEKNYLENLIKKYNLETHVRIISEHLSRQELNELYNASDFTALPSTKELFPNFSIIESLACGKPVIHSSIGGKRDIGGNGFAGFYVKYGDVEDLAERILFLSKNKSVRTKMSKNALELVNTKFSLDSVATNFSNIYDFILS